MSGDRSAGGPTHEEVLALVESDPRRTALTVRQMVRELGPGRGPRSALRRTVSELVQGGRLVQLRGRRFGSARLLGDVVGRFSRHRAGFGFVVPDDASEDLFIPPESQAGALHGDLVAARVARLHEGRRREGEIVRVVERGSRHLTGEFRREGGDGGTVVPLDAGHDFRVEVEKGGTEGAESGEVVRVELSRYPDGGRPARGRVVERLGRPDEPGIDVEILIRKYGFETEFPPEVAQEAESLDREPSPEELARRTDFTGETVVTIDGKTAKDFDDAVTVRATRDGYELDVHIADVAHFVTEGSELDMEALRRGTSVYFPDRVVPMLPERLSNDLCSLVPGELRLTQSVTIVFDGKGKPVSETFCDGYIRSSARLTYEEVADALEGGRLDRRSPEVAGMLARAGELAALVSSCRSERGAIDFDLPEPELILALTGETEDIVARSRNAAHRVIEEFMIAANEAVARTLVARRVPSLYRVHERPDADRVERLGTALAGLGYGLPDGTMRLEASDFGRLLDRARGRPEEPFVQRFVLRTMALARYDPECLGHFGLASKRYTHFTSPIRRYPDLVVHRALRRSREKGKVEDDGRLDEIARECSRLERDAESAERESLSWRRAAFMAGRVGDEFDGTVVEVGTHGLVVSVEEPYVEGLVPIRRLGSEYFRHDPRKMNLTGSASGTVFRLGQPIRVRVDRVDQVRHFIDFSLPGVDEEERRRETRRGPRRGGGRRRRR